MAIQANHTTSSSGGGFGDSFASPGFCRFDEAGIHLLSRYLPEYLIRWAEVRAVEWPQGKGRHDYLKVITTGERFANIVPVAEAEHARAAAEAIARFRPDLAG
ncbi:MAG: hypothetical protein KDJ80_13310 [Nitratireductor sp.]|nr:hypothetical protein [Nitratireductor sp.]